MNRPKKVNNCLRLSKISEATGPPGQATGPPRSGAGVGIGMLRGAGDSLTWKQKSLWDLPNFHFMLFDRDEIHIQYVVELLR